MHTQGFVIAAVEQEPAKLIIPYICLCAEAEAMHSYRRSQDLLEISGRSASYSAFQNVRFQLGLYIQVCCQCGRV